MTSNFHFQLTFEGIRGSSYRSDIAIDDVTVLEGNCPGNIYLWVMPSFLNNFVAVIPLNLLLLIGLVYKYGNNVSMASIFIPAVSKVAVQSVPTRWLDGRHFKHFVFRLAFILA